MYTIGYFSCLGLGYLFLEIVFIQKFTLFLANPIYSVSVVIASFLIFSGLGSAYFHVNTSQSHFPQKILLIAVVGILSFSGTYVVFLPHLLTTCAGWATLLKIIITILVIAPLGFCMGVPFPFGMNLLNQEASELVPWAYGINGCTSVLSSLLATSIAIPFGFRMVLLSAVCLYLLAAGTSVWKTGKKY
ncbi:hypothetical protein CSA56_05430 [candidate division KSB3 bacterium]|uniref:SAM-dependent methyltransferase n=1 Tax=candidate division KSB3 bacterium TaxID=2044937 RepID=A0A2G6KJC0_9BACT|nr:MAG: hypothetical protein CSA56_05430 [candidate division KSB3 bacterium]